MSTHCWKMLCTSLQRLEKKHILLLIFSANYKLHIYESFSHLFLIGCNLFGACQCASQIGNQIKSAPKKSGVQKMSNEKTSWRKPPTVIYLLKKKKKTKKRKPSTRWAPIPVINGVITPISRVISPVTHLQGHL